MKQLINIFSYASLLLIGILASCTSDEFGTNVGNTGYVSLNLSTGSATPASRVPEPGVDNLNENLIQTADVFVFNHSTNARVHYQRLESLQMQQGTGEIILSLSKSTVSTGTYDIYVIANYTGESLADVQSVDELKTKSTTTEFKFITGAREDSFLMDGKLENVSLAGGTSHTVNLYRAAAKIEINIQTGKADADENTYQLLGGLQKRIINYATNTKLLSDGNDLSDKGLKNTNYITFTGNQAQFYTYANSWAFDPESSQVDLNDETYILLNLPMKQVNSAGELIKEYTENYYRVSLNRSTGEQLLERNHFYKINVIVNVPGSSTEVTPIQLNGTIEIQEWHPININVGTDDAKFLEVNKESIYLANIDANESTDNSLIFYSSSVITNIEVSNVQYTDKYGVVRSFTRNDTDYPDGATYYPIINWNHDETTGAVTIHSKDLINVPKTFTLIITNDDGLTKEVKVEQYPLEYITSTQGWYSYRNDYNSSWIRKGSGKTTGSSDDGNFGSKVVERMNNDGTCVAYKYNWSGDRDEQPNYNLPSWNSSGKPYFGSKQNSGSTNARMYFVHITAASPEYKLGYPVLDSDGYTAEAEENKNIVSPAFMIASQLGNLNPTSFNYAKIHCKEYVEVTNVEFAGTSNAQPDDSKQEIYDDWRLPTEAEIKIINEFQKTANSAVSSVLTGRWYWTATGSYQANDEEPEGSSQVSTSTNARIRCVRDVKPEEIGN